MFDVVLGLATVALGGGLYMWLPDGHRGWGIAFTVAGIVLFVYAAILAKGLPSSTPSIQQKSEGANSPNVAGSGNTVNINPPAPNPNHGWLTPDNEPMPPSACDDIPPNTWRVYYGGTNTAIVSRMGQVRILQVGELLLSFDPDLVRQRIAISARIYTTDGMVAQIDQNEFTLNPNRIMKISHPDDHHLAVYNDWGDLVLDVDYLNPSAISVQGTFYTRRGEKFVIGKNGLTIEDGRGGSFTDVCQHFPFAVYFSPVG